MGQATPHVVTTDTTSTQYYYGITSRATNKRHEIHIEATMELLHGKGRKTHFLKRKTNKHNNHSIYTNTQNF